MSARAFTNQQAKEMVAAYRSGIHTPVLAVQYKVHPSTIWNWLKRLNVPIRRIDCSSPGKKNSGYKHGYQCGPYKREYEIFMGAKRRCTNPRNPHYNYYGGRGIQFKFVSFEQFIAEVGKAPTLKHTIDRINNNGHYEPGNIRWATRREQLMNRNPYKWRRNK